jgi:hypothetical protein
MSCVSPNPRTARMKMQSSRTQICLRIIRILAIIATAVPFFVGTAFLCYRFIVLQGRVVPTAYPNIPLGFIEELVGAIAAAWTVPLLVACVGIWRSRPWGVHLLALLSGIQVFAQVNWPDELSFQWAQTPMKVYTVFLVIVFLMAIYMATNPTPIPCETLVDRGFEVKQKPPEEDQ